MTFWDFLDRHWIGGSILFVVVAVMVEQQVINFWDRQETEAARQRDREPRS